MVTDSTSDEEGALDSTDEESAMPPIASGAPSRQTATLAPPGASATRAGRFAESRPDHRAIMADSSSEDEEGDMSSDSGLGIAPRRPGPRPAAARRTGPTARAANPAASNIRGAAAANTSASNNGGAAATSSTARNNRAAAAARALQSSSDEEGDGLSDSTGAGASSQSSQFSSGVFARNRSRPPGQ